MNFENYGYRGKWKIIYDTFNKVMFIFVQIP